MTPAKCYDKRCRILPMVEPEIKREYEKSEFKRHSFKGLDYTGAGQR